MPGADAVAFHTAMGRQAAEWSIPCAEPALEALGHYAELLLIWTARINLTGANSLDDLAHEHLPDAFALASRLRTAEPLVAIDVGSGGGLPALPLAVLCPQLTLRLFEPIAKKGAFLRTAIRELGLADRMTVVAKRAETAPHGTFDVAVSRATLPPPAWMALGATLVRPGGHVFVLASPDSDPGAPTPPLSLHDRLPYLGGRRVLLDLIRSDAPSDA